MRAVYVFVAILIVSIAVNILSGLYIFDLRDKIVQLQDSLLVSEKARAADHEAVVAYEKARTDAAIKAKERRDALQDISPDSPDTDILNACRNGLCPTGQIRSHAAPAESPQPLHNTSTTGGPDGR